MGIMLTLARRWCMPFGSWTLLITLHLLLAVSPHEDWRLLPGGIFTGLFADVLTQRIGASHVFALSVPFVLYALLFATLMLSGGLIWSMSLWLGGILLAGVVGVLMHMFIAPTSAYTSPLP